MHIRFDCVARFLREEKQKQLSCLSQFSTDSVPLLGLEDLKKITTTCSLLKMSSMLGFGSQIAQQCGLCQQHLVAKNIENTMLFILAGVCVEGYVH